MTLTEIMNLSAAELKERRSELVESMVTHEIPDLSGRLVQTLIDAKTRDEKLAEQGKTITLLQSALEKANQDAAESFKHAEYMNAELERATAIHNRQNQEWLDRSNATADAADASLAQLNAELAKTMARADRFHQLAMSGRQAIHDCANILNSVVSHFQITDAETMP